MMPDDFERLAEATEQRFFGKYRGTVTDNVDPDQLGSLQVVVPEVMGEQRLWAVPCAPYAGKDVGFFALPPVDAAVWVEFEKGISGNPVWTGCFWEKGELAAADASPDIVFLRTPGATIRIEASGVVEIETTGGAKITLTGSEILFEAPSIKSSANGASTALSAGGFDAMNGALKVV